MTKTKFCGLGFSCYAVRRKYLLFWYHNFHSWQWYRHPRSFLCKKDKLSFNGSYWCWFKRENSWCGNHKWSDSVLESLPVLHAIWGCNSVSAVNGKVKEKWLSTVQKKEENLRSVSQPGDTIRINIDVFQKIEKLFCHLYGMPDKTNINETRHRKFFMENTPEPHQLPPTKDELTQHIIRTNYEAYVWKRALDIPSPIGHGWERKDDQLCCVYGKSASPWICARTYCLHVPYNNLYKLLLVQSTFNKMHWCM